MKRIVRSWGAIPTLLPVMGSLVVLLLGRPNGPLIVVESGTILNSPSLCSSNPMCHVGILTGGRVEIQGAPDTYTPGISYPMTLEIEGIEFLTRVYGFQLIAFYQESGLSAGELVPQTQGTEIVQVPGEVSVLTHSDPLETGHVAFLWTAPETAAGPVVLRGAFCYTVSPKITPYVLLNFDGRTRDVSTLAHEFGHAMHSMAAADKPIMVSEAPLPLAEMASVFAEMLLNDKLAEKMSKKERKLLLVEEIDDMYATIMRQAYFTLFEIEAHHAIAEENATIDKVSKIYLSNLKEQFDYSLTITPDFQWEWLYIAHFSHAPFYCYAYTFGNLLVHSLYQQYKSEGKSFVPRYFDILSAGGSRKPEDLLKEYGIDISKEEFWQKGFDYVTEKVQHLKEI